MTDDKDFKHLVRDEARRSGRRYTEVRDEVRPPPVSPGDPTGEMTPAAVAERFTALVEAIESWYYGRPQVVRLVATALLVPGNVLFTGVAGNGMTALGEGVAAAIGGHVVSIDGRTGFDVDAAGRWTSRDVVVISHLDGLDPADQVAVVEAGRRPAIVLAKRHPISGRMPSPPDDETRDRFLFGVDLGYGDAGTELRIVNEVRDQRHRNRRSSAVDIGDLEVMRAAAGRVDVPDVVRRFAVDAIWATRGDNALALGGSTMATLALVQAAAAVAVAAGRERATVEDAAAMLRPVLAHRLVFRPGEAGEASDANDIDAVIERARSAAAPTTSARG